VKVAIVISSLQRGGAEGQIIEFVRATHPEHAQCVVICQGDEGSRANELHAVNAKVIALGLVGPLLGVPGIVRFASGLWRFVRVLRNERPDVVYAFLFWGYTISLPLTALVLPRACRIQGRRSLPEADIPRHSILRELRRIANRCSHGVIVNSLAVGSTVARCEPSLSGRLWVVPNGVKSVAPRPPSTKGRLTIVCVANLRAPKGHVTLLGAMSKLRHSDWYLLLVGEGPERDSIERMIIATGLQERVSMLGRRSDVHEILESADLLVHPSYSEGMPNAVLEAMAHGIPVVASDVGGVRSLLGSGAGIIVPPADEDALVEALQRLIDDPALRAHLGDRGRTLTQGSLGVEVMREATLSAISEICEQRRDQSALQLD
jgi:glycosyltransferase involved in cell wall biosynthesis